ncbi:hypothetical protein SCOR_18005 [Sulfidibacter corallicola]|uniref:Zinc-finger domain-containing protein n=1 Tax=Sulfidibacter corallicola TaxID=2818388 RepID=A0A8A4TXF4_SULCO|nr:hypothetical protein [Sulfidibacter corallicola]QTD53652.1 hypothetical protein J3U87_14455 [Sulfidibacter corallicola]
MTPEELESLISRDIDSELNREEAAELERVLATSAEARHLHEDLHRLQSLLGEEPIPSAPQPSEATLANLEREARTRFGRRSPIRGLVLAVAAALVIGFGVWLWFDAAPSTQKTLPGERTTGQWTEIRAEIDRTQREFDRAIKKMEGLAETRIAQMPEAQAAHLAADLREIDAAIARCRDLLETHPQNHMLYASLARAYQAKVDLLEKIISS